MGYQSIREIADEWGIPKRRIQVLCSENRIEGVVRIGIHGQFRQMQESLKTQE